ncbi:cation:proton antiporter [Exilibacterium tricleocarpae]|uniref:Cation:proton antiporter n=1 Tax=Exilibacterium tricleocarpae TaxID=2591008 RepID=A0A545TVN7_9GAMM|nr:cation:proton antiporter [Exilibacterium tricleocarpae]TQV81290.1 cation:proton antiporter [Exilibacterium tricleocarpae]
MGEPVVQTFFLIFTGAAVLASIALYTRQPLLVAYIVLGAVLGPYGMGLITNVHLITEISHIGIIFLLFLLGLDMQPRALLSVLRKATSVALISSLVFAVTGFAIGYLFGYGLLESMVIGMAMMFSSTIIGIKLLPTTVLHHKHTGELMVGLLLLQDFLAILCLMLLLSGDVGRVDMRQFLLTIVALPLLALFSVAFVRYVLLKLIQAFDRFHEYIFLLAIGWCLGLAELSEALGLSAEIGAFLAGITIATSPISQYIAISLKPLRDFFLILFFFSLGASFNLNLLSEVIVASVVLAAAMLVIKPVVFRVLLRHQSEKNSLAWDIGFRLGQISEFSLLIAFVATNAAIIGQKASHLIQATAIITFLVSSYIVIFNYPSPIAVSDRLRRD